MDDNAQAGAASTIQAIDKGSVHRICSGQVVLNLATAVKELVENSIDAGANNVEIRLKEYGSECLEVVDNGKGVEEANFEGLTLKHHTSKLKDFSDLVNVETFGFRGEALSSLCALSKLTITTRHHSVSVGTKLEYDHHGQILKKTPCSRQVGTSVTLEQLFSTLPVRHKEFLRNLKKDFAKMIQVLNAYCIISTGVRVSCTNQVGKSKKNTLLNTSGNKTIRENVTNIFGSKQVQSLLEFEQCSPEDDVCSDYGIKQSGAEKDIFSVQGLVSTCDHGKGRSSADRQFYFVNKRPCDLSKVAKVLNEVYHMYNRHQYPFVLLDISLNKESVDVNVTPDKRMVFMQHEKLLLATIKHSLIRLYEPLSSQYQVAKMDSFLIPGRAEKSPLKKSYSSPVPSTQTSHTSIFANLKRSFSSAFSKEDTNKTPFESPKAQSTTKQRRLDTFLSSESISATTRLNTSGEMGYQVVHASPSNTTSPTSSQTSGVSSEVFDSSISLPATVELISDSGNSQSSVGSYDVNIYRPERTAATPHVSPDGCSSSQGDTGIATPVMEHLPPGHESPYAPETGGSGSAESHAPEEVRLDGVSATPGTSHPGPGGDTQSPPATSKTPPTLIEVDRHETVERKERSVTLCMRSLRERLAASNQSSSAGDVEGEAGKATRQGRSFCAQISPADNTAAEDELRKEIRKDMFQTMQILGQFNLGFIIAKLGPDLFIIDQHASDEKYNFETLQRHTVLQGQKLIRPQNLHLTAMNETVLLDNIDIFKANGFEFTIEEDAPCGQRARLLSMPVSKNWSFGKDDVDELIFMLADSPGVMCRPTRVRQMFASRACRKSVMIGTALNKPEMRKLVTHMGEIEQPWNCPHGRPTMRHLINLNMLQD